jgi:hypothetical protein
MDRWEIIDLNIRVHQRLLASRAFHQNPDPTIHNMPPFLSSPSVAGILEKCKPGNEGFRL